MKNMKMKKSDVLRVGADRLLPGLQVIAHHGELEPDQTPARRGAVLADAAGRIIHIGEARPVRPKDGMPAPEYEVSPEVVGSLDPGGGLPGIGTRIGPWPARLGDYVVTIGRRELRCVGRMQRQQPVSGEPARVQDFLRWTVGTEMRSEPLTCERIDEHIAWYCSENEAFALWKRIQPVALEELRYAVNRRGEQEIIDVAYWLTRAALSDEDIYLAVAAMRLAGYQHWRALLEAGVQPVAEKQQQRALQEAEESLARPPLARTSGPDHDLRRRQQESIDESFACLQASAPKSAA